MDLTKIPLKEVYFYFICKVDGLKNGIYFKDLMVGGLPHSFLLKIIILSILLPLFMTQNVKIESNGL
jgi:hypothetical protein